MRVSPVLLLLMATTLSGCFRGSNVKGDFACKAPGGTCAPMSSIDMAAIAGIGAGAGAGTSAAPLGALRSPGSLPPPQAPRTVSTAGLDDSAPARTSERVLRVVFPAHIDKDGVYREESAAHAVIEPTTWAQALGAPASEPRRVPVLRQGSAVPAVQPPAQPSAAASGSLLASMDEVVAAQAARRTGAAAAPAPAPALTAAPSPPAVGAIISQFSGVSRAPAALSLAEAASGLSAPLVVPLDPAGPGNYDTPDLAAVAAPSTASAPAVVRSKSLASRPNTLPEGPPEGPPEGSVMRTVRWKGKTYTIPVGKPAARQAPAADLTTADLNRRALARTAPAETAARTPDEGDVSSAPEAPPRAASAPASPSVSPTADARTPQARVRSMAGPQLPALVPKEGFVELAPAANTASATGAPRP